ncbi:MAG TPA: hypothetical protein VN451_00425, partial [Chitinophagaceae bacterium]|nr:hypothetical protein [Chitinophagaceae bacterium]
VLVWLLLAGCSNKPAADDKTEKLLGLSFSYDKKEITVTVVSTGCTTRADFSFAVNANTIKIERIKKDECKAMPEAINLVYTFQETGISADKKYTVANSFIANPNLANIR